MKKQLLILMTLLISIIGSSQTVGDTFIEDFITYQVTSIAPNTVRVNDYDHNNGSTDVVIPITVSNSSTSYSVTSINSTAFENNGSSNFDVTSVIIPNSITSIGDEAFKSQDLTTVTIPSSVINIGNQAFIGNNLTSVTLENGLETIGEYAFNNNQLINIDIPNSVVSIGQLAFSGNQLTSVTLSNSLTSIENNVFQQNQLQSIVIPNSVTSIGNASFNNNQLTSVTLSNNLLTIGNSTFQNNNITHVTVPSSVTNIEFAAFRDNPLATVTSQGTTPATIFMPGINDSFWNRSVIDLTIPSGTSAAYAVGGWTGFNSVTEASALAVNDTFVVDFITYRVTSVTPDIVEVLDYNMAGGTVVNIPETVSHSIVTYNVTNIVGNAFNSKGLTSVFISDNITNIGSQAFVSNSLTSVTIGNSVQNIGGLAFDSNNLTSVIIPNSVTVIEARAFDDNQITTVTLGSNVTTIEFGAFRNNALTTVTSLAATPPTVVTSTSFPGVTDSFNHDRSNIALILPNATTDEYVTDSGALWTGFKIVYEVIPSNNTLKVTDYEAANGTTVSIPATVADASVIYDVSEIGNAAFFDKGLTSITFPNSITTINTSAFNTNNLTSITIPDSVIIIGSQAFANNNINNLVIGNSVTNIDFAAFAGNQLTNITIPNNVTNIGSIAFAVNPLTDVTSLATIPPTITTGTNDTFDINGDRSNIHLHIPPGTMGAYVTDPGALWINFNPVTEDALSVSDFELANDIKVITTADGIKVVASNNIRLENYTLFNISGQNIAEGSSTEISTNTLAKGIYLLKLNFDKGTVVRKVIIN